MLVTIPDTTFLSYQKSTKSTQAIQFRPTGSSYTGKESCVFFDNQKSSKLVYMKKSK